MCRNGVLLKMGIVHVHIAVLHIHMICFRRIIREMPRVGIGRRIIESFLHCSIRHGPYGNAPDPEIGILFWFADACIVRAEVSSIMAALQADVMGVDLQAVWPAIGPMHAVGYKIFSVFYIGDAKGE